MAAEIPHNEEERLQILHDLRILDTDPDETYDIIARLASNIMETDLALISLIDKDRQWCKSAIGIQNKETSRASSICSYTILYPHKEMIIEDATKDDRFVNHPAVISDPNVRFYFGVPLVSNECAIGAICVLDVKARVRPTENQIISLKELSKLVVIQLELRKSILEINDNIEIIQKVKYNHSSDYKEINQSCIAILEKIKARKSSII